MVGSTHFCYEQVAAQIALWYNRWKIAGLPTSALAEWCVRPVRQAVLRKRDQDELPESYYRGSSGRFLRTGGDRFRVVAQPWRRLQRVLADSARRRARSRSAFLSRRSFGPSGRAVAATFVAAVSDRRTKLRGLPVLGPKDASRRPDRGSHFGGPGARRGSGHAAPSCGHRLSSMAQPRPARPFLRSSVVFWKSHFWIRGCKRLGSPLRGRSAGARSTVPLKQRSR